MDPDFVAELGAASKERRRRAADELIARISRREVLEAVEAALVDPSAERRWGAAFVLYRSGARQDRVYRAALDALAFADGDVRWAAAEIVVAMASGDDGRVESLATLTRQADAPARKMALYCLRDLGNADAALFSAALDDADRGVRLAAIAGLLRFDRLPSQAVAGLERVTRNDPDAGVQRAAAVALGRHAPAGSATRTSLESLRSTTNDPDLARAIDRALRTS